MTLELPPPSPSKSPLSDLPGTESASVATTTTTEPGTRPVKTSEVIKHGKKKCGTCHGAGMFNVQSRPGGVSELKVCGCAIARFVKVNAKNLTLHKETGSWFWST